VSQNASRNKELVLRFIDALDVGGIKTAAACFDAERYYSLASRRTFIAGQRDGTQMVA
jgi:hypothetical protein